MLSYHCNLRGQALVIAQQRFKTAKFKTKIAKTRPTQTPTMMALDHFDFYYGPMFGKRWPSIRLGLLSPNKYVAVVNTMSRRWEAHEDLLGSLGTFDLLARIRGKTATERIEENKKRVMEKATSDLAHSQADIESSNTRTREDEQSTASDTIMRTAAGLGEFRKPEGQLTPGELQMGSGRKNKKDENRLDFEITGYEGEGFRFPRREHFIYYPRDLHVLTYDRCVFEDYPPPIKDDQGTPSWWLLDGGSLVPILALGLEKGDHVLDVCAAPGGKSLVALLSGLPDKLVCNDYKMARLGQLKRALSTYIPPDSPVVDKVILKRKDAGDIASWDEFNVYDKIIADVPCSTDRMAVSHDEGNMFSTGMSNLRLSLPQLQAKILINSLRALKVGGSVVYSTCTLASNQNEAVVENACAIAERRFGIKVVEESLSQLTTHLQSSGLFRFSDQCRIGSLLLPFISSNFGPMYVCKLTRLS